MPQPRKTVFITGCSSGIGHALAKEYHAKGLTVFASARRLVAMNDLSALGIHTLALDVTDISSVRAARAEVEATLAKEGLLDRIDILVNNAGLVWNRAVVDEGADSDDTLLNARRLFDTNVLGVMAVTQEFLPLLRKAANGSSNSVIVNVGSGAGVAPMAFGSYYAASKAAINHWSNILRLELRPLGIHVSTVVLGVVETPMHAEAAVRFPQGSPYQSLQGNLDRLQSMPGSLVTDVARDLVLDSLKTHPTSRYFIGKGAGGIWFLHAFFPAWLTEWVSRRIYGLSKLKELS